jgi:6,7-dimethyl-8-ribityllumazine synthase
MASAQYNINDIIARGMPDATGMRVGIVVSEWNDSITLVLTDGAAKTLKQYGVKEEDILIKTVPGSFELIYGSSLMAQSHEVDAVIAIGCIIRGETPHFDFIAQGTTNGLAALNAQGEVPVIFGVLTCSNRQQAEERSGGVLGNKGEEYGATAIKMIAYRRSLEKK